MHEGRGYRYTFQRVRVASSPEVPKVTWWKIATFLGYHLHWLTPLETLRHFRKIALRLGIFLAMFRECLCVVARQLAPKCRDFSNVAKLARQCKWPYTCNCAACDTSTFSCDKGKRLAMEGTVEYIFIKSLALKGQWLCCSSDSEKRNTGTPHKNTSELLW